MRLYQLPVVIGELERAQISVRSDKVSASLMSTPRYRTVFSMSVCEQDLDGSQVAGRLVDERDFRAPQRVRAIFPLVQADREGARHDEIEAP